MTQRFFGQLKDEGDIAFHFGFEGCAGYGDFLSRMSPYEILYAYQDDFSDVIPIPGLKGFVMVVRRRDAQTHDTGLFEVVTMGADTTPDDLQFEPTTVEKLRAFTVSENGDMPAPGYVDFVNNTFPLPQEDSLAASFCEMLRQITEQQISSPNIFVSI